MFDLNFYAILYLFLGAIVIGFGGVLSELGFHKIGAKDKYKGWMFLCFGALVIGLGGLFASMGWAERENEAQRKTAIIALIRENDYNNYLYNQSGLLKLDSAELRSEGAFYPRFKNDVSIQLMLSGLYPGISGLDGQLSLLLSKRVFRIDDINRRFDISDQLALSAFMKDTSIVTRNLVESIRRPIVESEKFHWYENIRRETDSFLIYHYPWLENYRIDSLLDSLSFIFKQFNESM